MRHSAAYPRGSIRIVRTLGIVVTTSSLLLAQNQETGFSPNAFTGRWGTRNKIEAKGIEPFAELTAEAWSNVSGGLKRGTWYNHLLDFGLRLDTTKLGWWDGGSFLVQGHWVENAGNATRFDEFTGGFNPVSGIMAGDHIRVFNLFYQDAWHEETVTLKLGQLAADDDFMGSDYAGLFLNSAFGAMPSQVGTPLAASCSNVTAFPIYSVADPGVFLQVRPSEVFYTQLGLYYGRPGFDKPSNYGFDWIDETPPELGVFWESGLNYKLANWPAALRLGLSYHTGPLDNFVRIRSGDSAAIRQAVPNYYAIHDLELLAGADGKPKLGLFVRGGVTPEPDLSMVNLYADAGLNWFAPLTWRPEDIAGVAVSGLRQSIP